MKQKTKKRQIDTNFLIIFDHFLLYLVNSYIEERKGKEKERGGIDVWKEGGNWKIMKLGVKEGK